MNTRGEEEKKNMRRKIGNKRIERYNFSEERNDVMLAIQNIPSERVLITEKCVLSP